MAEQAAAWSGLPGPGLGAVLAGVELAGLDDGELVDVVAAWRRQASWAQAGELAAVAELGRRRGEESSAAAEFASAEVGLALTLSPRSADAHLELARTLAGRLADTRVALVEGRIDLVRARIIAQGTRAVDDDAARRVQARVLADAGQVTPGRLRARVERAVIAVDPAGAERRRAVCEADRRVMCYDTGNGTAVLGGVHLPAGPAIAADNRVHAIATALKADGDSRTLQQLSADVFVSLLLGTHPGSGLPATAAEDHLDGRRPHPAAIAGAVGERIGTVHLTVPLATLLGLSSAPGEAAGYGPLTAEVARQMAATASNPTTRWCLTVTTTDGQPLHHGHLAYRPPAAMAHAVRSLQPTCRFPGCTRPSKDCDLDHRTPYDQEGPTCPCNLQPLCRRHHRAKGSKGWTVTRDGERLLWTTPAGRSYSTRPEPPPPQAVRPPSRRPSVEARLRVCLRAGRFLPRLSDHWVVGGL